MFPEIRFIEGDLLKERPLSGEYFDLVVIKEVLWYVCHNLEHFIKNVLSMIKEDGFLYVSQSFPETDKWIGQETIGSPERLKEILSKFLKPITVCYEKEYYNWKGIYLHHLGKSNENQ